MSIELGNHGALADFSENEVSGELFKDPANQIIVDLPQLCVISLYEAGSSGSSQPQRPSSEDLRRSGEKLREDLDKTRDKSERETPRDR